MKYAQTIEEVKQMLADYDCQLQQAGATVQILFPETDKGYGAQGDPGIPEDAHMFPETDDPQGHGHYVRNGIRSILAEPEFWRQTTVAQQLDNYFRFTPDGKWFNATITKRAGDPLTLTFRGGYYALEFIELAS